MGKMLVLNHSGHAEVEWDTSDQRSVAVAEREFRSLKTKGYSPFVRVAPGNPDMFRISNFEPDVDEILWVKPLVGG